MRIAKSCFRMIIVVCMYLSFLTSSGIAADMNLTCSKEVAITVTQNIASGLGSLLKNIKDRKRRITAIRSFIDPIRFYSDQSGYFYVYDSKCVNIAHATQRELQDKNLFDYKDSKGKFVIQELAAAAKKGGGFVEYYWIKPGEKVEKKKIGYVVPIPNTDYFIGTGVYAP